MTETTPKNEATELNPLQVTPSETNLNHDFRHEGRYVFTKKGRERVLVKRTEGRAEFKTEELGPKPFVLRKGWKDKDFGLFYEIAKTILDLPVQNYRQGDFPYLLQEFQHHFPEVPKHQLKFFQGENLIEMPMIQLSQNGKSVGGRAAIVLTPQGKALFQKLDEQAIPEGQALPTDQEVLDKQEAVNLASDEIATPEAISIT